MGRFINPIPALTAAQVDRFWSKVEVIPGCCWEWQGSLSKTGGYGSVHIRTKTYKSHRVAYALLVGDTFLELDHLCRNRTCVNPDHLQPVTSLENFARGQNPKAVLWRTNKCSRGHDLTPENTIYKGVRRDRRCRTCHVRDYQNAVLKRSAQRAERRAQMVTK